MHKALSQGTHRMLLCPGGIHSRCSDFTPISSSLHRAAPAPSDHGVQLHCQGCYLGSWWEAAAHRSSVAAAVINHKDGESFTVPPRRQQVVKEEGDGPFGSSPPSGGSCWAGHPWKCLKAREAIGSSPASSKAQGCSNPMKQEKSFSFHPLSKPPSTASLCSPACLCLLLSPNLLWANPSASAVLLCLPLACCSDRADLSCIAGLPAAQFFSSNLLQPCRASPFPHPPSACWTQRELQNEDLGGTSTWLPFNSPRNLNCLGEGGFPNSTEPGEKNQFATLCITLYTLHLESEPMERNSQTFRDANIARSTTARKST